MRFHEKSHNIAAACNVRSHEISRDLEISLDLSGSHWISLDLIGSHGNSRDWSSKISTRFAADDLNQTCHVRSHEIFAQHIYTICLVGSYEAPLVHYLMMS